MAQSTTVSPPAGRAEASPAVALPARFQPGLALAGAVILVLAYAAFARGGTGLTELARLQVVVSLLSAATLALFLWGGQVRLAATRGAWIGLGLLAGFAAWCVLSFIWTVAPDETWLQVNRAILYAQIVFLGIAAGASHAKAPERLAGGYLVVAVAVALYAFGGKVLPGLHIGPLDLDHTKLFSRLRAPLEYWNALAIFCVMAVPIALRFGVDQERTRNVRLLSLAAVQLLLIIGALTYSRGAVLALVVAVAVTLVLAGSTLRSLLALGLALITAVPSLALAFASDDLTTNNVPVVLRGDDGVILGLVYLAGLGALTFVSFVMLGLEGTVKPDPLRQKRIRTVLLAALAVAVGSLMGALLVSERGPIGTLSDQVDSFTEVRSENQADPARLVTTNSGNRWVWWKESVGAWSDHPLHGFGAGSFPVTHRQYRSNRLDVRQPHSVPLQFLAETGLIGFLLAMGGIGLLLWAAVLAVRRVPHGSRRSLMAAMCAGVVAWVVHGFVDWDWDIPGVTLPALAFAGVLAGSAAAGRRGGSGDGLTKLAEASPPATDGARIAVLTAAAALLSVAALSSILPAWSASRASSTVSELGLNPSPDQRGEATRRLRLAARLDPTSIQPLVNASFVALRGGRPDDALVYLEDAVERQPNSAAAWQRLAQLRIQFGDVPGYRAATTRALELDPKSRIAQSIVGQTIITLTPPQDSATATGSPLPTVIDGGGEEDVDAESLPPWTLAVPQDRQNGVPGGAGADGTDSGQ